MLQTFQKRNLSSSSTAEESFRNIITGKLFSDAIYEDLIGAYGKGQNLYQIFADEALKPDSKVGILVKLQKAKVNTCRSVNKAVKLTKLRHLRRKMFSSQGLQ